MITLNVNNKRYDVDVEPDTPLLWVIRDHLGLEGTKYGCGIGQCGACTVIIDGQAVRSCVRPVSAAANKEITTIEGLPPDHPVKRAWIAGNVPQCGYCQPGQIMQATVLLSKTPIPNDDDIDRAMTGNICRCGTYQRIRRAIHEASGIMAEEGKK
jgi:isoquinoline 1-oxidoreductase alpha subunit